MRISDLYNNEKTVLSFEVFPPKKTSPIESVYGVLEELCDLKPAYMSVTYGAAGTTRGFTLDVAGQIRSSAGIPVMPHMTCIASTRNDVDTMLGTIRDKGIDNIMALRGDIPQDGVMQHDFEHASDLVAYIRSTDAGKDICIGGACYPEGHVESPSMASDIDNLRKKVDAGTDFLTTQMFFDNTTYFNFLYKLREAGITVPVLPGIMPITAARQLSRSVALSGTSVPARFRAIVDHFGSDPEAMKQAGIIYASEQIIDLLANGIRNIHVYSMNKPDVAEGILNNLQKLI
jgi:methylenetetrahydrofolate reductase (NADPH)